MDDRIGSPRAHALEGPGSVRPQESTSLGERGGGRQASLSKRAPPRVAAGPSRQQAAVGSNSSGASAGECPRGMATGHLPLRVLVLNRSAQQTSAAGGNKSSLLSGDGVAVDGRRFANLPVASSFLVFENITLKLWSLESLRTD